MRFRLLIWIGEFQSYYKRTICTIFLRFLKYKVSHDMGILKVLDLSSNQTIFGGEVLNFRICQKQLNTIPTPQQHVPKRAFDNSE